MENSFGFMGRISFSAAHARMRDLTGNFNATVFSFTNPVNNSDEKEWPWYVGHSFSGRETG
jgi:hypothetical protein